MIPGTSGFQSIVPAAADQAPLLLFPAARELERQMLQSVAARGFGCDWSVWRTHQSLVVPSLTTNAPNFRAASVEMSLRGWPVHVRDTGGDVTPQSPGIVNVSAAFIDRRTPELSIRATYERFCAPLLMFLETLGIEAYLSSVRGSFCDGAFNIVVGDKKLAGTAQKWRLTKLQDGTPGVAVLAHAAILADPDIEESILATNQFYRLCGDDREVVQTQHVSMATLLPGSQPIAAAFSARLSDFLEPLRSL